MPIIKSAIKRMHQNATHRTRNLNVKKNLKDATKAFRAKPSSVALSKAQSQLDIAVKKNLLKTGTAARRKAQLAKEAKAAGVKLTASTKKKVVTPKTTPKKAPAKKPVAKTTAIKKPAAKKPVVKKTTAAKTKNKLNYPL